jgi:tRNA (guanine10-N2)-methyltransferase
MEMFDVLKFKGKVSLKKAQRTFIVIDNHYRGMKYFGKLIAGKDDKDALYFSKYNLNTRKYLGPTTMDNLLGFVMTNLGQVQYGDNILDPFVGTGSLLIPSSHFGALAYGCDIDIRVLKGFGIGYTKPEKGQKVIRASRESNVFTNFSHYGLNLPQIIRADINHSVFKQDLEYFDMIVCDPPYGHRAFTRATGMETGKKEKRQVRLRKKYGKLLEDKDEEGVDVEEFEDDEDSENEELNKELKLDSELNKNNLGGDEKFVPKQCNCEFDKIKLDSEVTTITNDVSDIKIKNEKEVEIKVGGKIQKVNTNGNMIYAEKDPEMHFFSPLKACSVEDLFVNLLSLGNQVIKKGGNLVCLYPTRINKGDEE